MCGGAVLLETYFTLVAIFRDWRKKRAIKKAKHMHIRVDGYGSFMLPDSESDSSFDIHDDEEEDGEDYDRNVPQVEPVEVGGLSAATTSRGP
ncbi:hypothetical protein PT974_07206 [Cladobotryum mycophilum]|uniref:Uncharacterized protein n=1 Tax=Cladobotryum mycophilum TaxID=491253 RepID=A0ABR0SNZ6_9HYPO